MFEFLNDLVSACKAHPESGNQFFPLDAAKVSQAEARLGRAFPRDLVTFYNEIGCGFLRSPSTVPFQRPYCYFNRFIGPNEIVDLMVGEHPATPAEGFDDGEIPFFEVGEQLHLVLRSSESELYAVCWSCGEEVAPNLVEFVRRLMANPRFYN